MGRSQRIITASACLLIALSAAICPTTARADSDDMGLCLTAGASHKLNKRWSVGGEVEFRSRNDFKTADRISVGVNAGYKLMKGLKASAGYSLLVDNNMEHITFNDDYSYNNWRPSYWGVRHRFNVSLTGSIDIQRVSISLRERWQYTYRPHKMTDNFDFDEALWETVEVRGKGKNVLRSKLQVDWNIPHCKFDPFASVEFYNAWELEKTKLTVGVDYNINKTHYFEAFYRYQKPNEDDDDNEINSHIIGLSYTFKF